MSGSTIGIDPSVDAPAFAIWPSAQTWQFKTRGDGSARLHNLYERVGDWMHCNLVDDLEAVFIERPVGKFPKRALDHACGVIQVAVIEAARDLYEYPVSVFELSPGEWKRRVLGNGAAKKDEVFDWAYEQTHATDPRDRLTQDEADALAIAAAGHQALSESVAA